MIGPEQFRVVAKGTFNFGKVFSVFASDYFISLVPRRFVK